MPAVAKKYTQRRQTYFLYAMRSYTSGAIPANVAALIGKLLPSICMQGLVPEINSTQDGVTLCILSMGTLLIKAKLCIKTPEDSNALN